MPEKTTINEDKIKRNLFGSVESIFLPWTGKNNPNEDEDLTDLRDMAQNPNIRIASFCTGCGSVFGYPHDLAEAFAENSITKEEFTFVKKEEQFMITSKCLPCTKSKDAPEVLA